ncbi:hypothetical protein EJ03DRAFT_330490 [Teratosphaeria nubilosa]|uniref:Uncharacterized protein n=1 Tax=Teratosphaeria nubilosa TaxID=161662 RepID=A0A6G1L081_9PEZI|nr:hypothetical protein EJ03DRAFT_330490 [Teratosphaeria nubilosa]
MASTHPTTFGASIVPVAQQDEGLRVPSAISSPALTPAVSRDDINTQYDQQKPVPIHSPFYQHPPASFERVPQHSRNASRENVAAFDKDMESGSITPLSTTGDDNPFTSKIGVEINKECKMWPSKQTLMQQRSDQKRMKIDKKGMKGCAPLREWWSQYNKRQKLYMKIAFALLIVGILVAIGVGISIAVDGTYYGQDGNQHQVDQKL